MIAPDDVELITGGSESPVPTDDELMARVLEVSAAVKADLASLTELDMAKLIGTLEKGLSNKPLQLATPTSRLPLPVILFPVGRAPFNAGTDSKFMIDLLGANTDEQKSLFALGLFWSMYLDRFPDEAFQQLAQAASKPSVSVVDVVRLSAVLGYWAGQPLANKASKEIWNRLHSSPSGIFLHA